MLLRSLSLSALLLSGTPAVSAEVLFQSEGPVTLSDPTTSATLYRTLSAAFDPRIICVHGIAYEVTSVTDEGIAVLQVSRYDFDCYADEESQ